MSVVTQHIDIYGVCDPGDELWFAVTFIFAFILT